MENVDKIRAAKRVYARKYRQEHPDRIKAAQERYWLRQAEKLLERRGKEDGEAGSRCG